MTFHIISKFIMIVKTFLKKSKERTIKLKRLKKEGNALNPPFIVTIDLKHVVMKH